MPFVLVRSVDCEATAIVVRAPAGVLSALRRECKVAPPSVSGGITRKHDDEVILDGRGEKGQTLIQLMDVLEGLGWKFACALGAGAGQQYLFHPSTQARLPASVGDPPALASAAGEPSGRPRASSRSFTPEPRWNGPPPAELAARIAKYEKGLRRMKMATQTVKKRITLGKRQVKTDFRTFERSIQADFRSLTTRLKQELSKAKAAPAIMSPSTASVATEKELVDLKAQLSSKTAEVDALEEETTALARKLAAAEARCLEIQANAQREADARESELTEERKDADDREAALTSALHEAQAALSKLRQDVDTAKASAAAEREAATAAERQMEELRETLHAAETAAAKVVPLETKVASLEAEVARLKPFEAEVSGMQAKVDAAQAAADEASSRASKMSSLAKKHKASAEKASEALEALRAETATLQERCDEAETQLASAREEIAELKSQATEMLVRIKEHDRVRRRLYNVIQDLRGNIRVICRVRPLLDSESSSIRADSTPPDTGCFRFPVPDPKDVKEPLVVMNREDDLHGAKHNFAFDKVFHPLHSQEDVFQEVSPLLQSALDGYSVTIFAYGATGSGKTFTMEGYSDAPEPSAAPSSGGLTIDLVPMDAGASASRPVAQTWAGIIPRTFDLLFEGVAKMAEEGWHAEILASQMEIYNETIRDLLSSDPSSVVDVRDVGADASDSVLTAEPVNSPDQVLRVLKRGNKARSTSSTLMNDRSSRSHSVLRLSIRMTRNLGEDLADPDADAAPSIDTALSPVSVSLSFMPSGPMSATHRKGTPTSGLRRLPASSPSSPSRARAGGAGSARGRNPLGSPSSVASGGARAGAGAGEADGPVGAEEITSVIHLVDLAGSEKVSQSGATGQQLKEACAINKSLSALGDVIAALGRKEKHVPFRNSKLTSVLQHSLGGQSKVLCVINAAPSEVQRESTLSSLRFGQRVNAVELGAAVKSHRR